MFFQEYQSVLNIFGFFNLEAGKTNAAGFATDV